PPMAVVAATLLNDVVFNAQIDQVALAADTAVVHQVELGLAERRRHLVLDHAHLGPRADRYIAVLDARHFADVQAHRAVELQGQAAGSRFGVAEHDADLLADLVDEDHARLGAGDGRIEDAQRLAHEAGLNADVRIADLALNLGLGHQGGHGINDDQIDGVGLDQHLGDAQRLLGVARLADQQAFQIDADALGPAGIEGVLGVDVGGHAALFLGVGHGVQGHGRLAARLRPENLNDASSRQAPPTHGDVQAQRTGRDALHVQRGGFSQLYDGALADVLLDLRQDVLQFLTLRRFGHVFPLVRR